MDALFQPRLRIAVVTTRELGTRAGRPGILLNIIRTLETSHDVQVFRLKSLTEAGGLAVAAGGALRWLKSLVLGRPLPLQCLLYAAPRECARLAAEIERGRFDAVYLDTVRCQMLLRRLSRGNPRPHIVTDFDDLMSRRAEQLFRGHMPLVLGHVAPSVPPWLQRLIEHPLARLVTFYEAMTLKAAEREVVARSDSVALLSAVECQMLQARMARGHRDRIQTVPPAVHIRAAPWRSDRPLRFIFIGNDALLHNRMSIAFLTDTWRKLRPKAELHIYGKQAGACEEIAGVHRHGFVSDLAEVYQPGSIALAPVKIAGGVKTKVAEAWAWGCPVLGNMQAFEGFAIGAYPLIIPERSWDPYLLHPDLIRELWVSAARKGQQFVRRNLSPETFAYSWKMIMRPLAAAANGTTPAHHTIAAREAD